MKGLVLPIIGLCIGCSLVGWSLGSQHQEDLDKAPLQACQDETKEAIILCEEDCQVQLDECWMEHRETPLEDIEEMVEDALRVKDGVKR